MPTRNPLRVDPTRTAGVRRQFVAEMRRRFNDFRKEVVQLVRDEDAFGLQPPEHFTINTRFAFETDTAKIAAFRKWLQERINANLLIPDVGTPGGQPWMSKYLTSAYQQGRVRAFTDANKAALSQSLAFYQGTREQFLQSAFIAPQTTKSLEMLFTRSFDQLRGITSTMDAQLSRELADGLAFGRGPREIARRMSNSITAITKRRALVLARTEVIHAHAEGQLDSFEELGVQEIGIESEWSTAGDDRVCPQCAAREGKVYTVKDARGLIPLHPNCRCAWIPVLTEPKRKRKLEDSIKRSVGRYRAKSRKQKTSA